MAVDTSYLTSQVNTIVEQLHGLFDDIGVPHHERESRESEVSTLEYLGLAWWHARPRSLLTQTQLFSALSETLHGHLQRVDE